MAISCREVIFASFCVVLLISLSGCAGIQLGNINPPPTTGKLRLYVQPVSGYGPPQGWSTPHSDFVMNIKGAVHRILAFKGIYQIVPDGEVDSVVGGYRFKQGELEENNCALAMEIGRRLYADYTVVLERRWNPPSFRIALINVETGRVFKAVNRAPGRGTRDDFGVAIQASYDEIFKKAQQDLMDTAARKRRSTTEQMAEREKELQFIRKDSEGKKKQEEMAEKEETGTSVKEVNLQKEISDLSGTLAELEEVKRRLDEEKRRSEKLAQELREQEDRQKKLLDQLKEGTGAPPVIVIANPQDQIKVEVKTIFINGAVEDDLGLEKVDIFVNENPLRTWTKRGISGSQPVLGERFDFEERIRLQSGTNRIKVLAVDSDGLASEKVITVYAVEKQRRTWGVVIGINQYPKVRQLRYAVNDAKAFYSYLLEIGQVPKDNVVLLLDEEATLTRIRSTLGTYLKEKAGKEDMVIIFFAGHGAPEKDVMSPDGDGLEKYLLPYDVDPRDLYASALPMREISHIFHRIRSERLIFFADACYSGASGGRTIEVSGMRTNLSEAFLERIAGGKGRVIITASDANEVSAEDDQFQHGVFTYYLVEGLKGPADGDGDGLITVDEVYGYVSDRVPEATKQEQHPVKKGTVEGRLVLGIVK